MAYFLAFYLGHVPGFMPYVSDCGVLIPERTVFSELINIAVFLQLLFSYFRYEQVSSVKNYSIKRGLVVLNKWCASLGVCISFGLSLIGNAQLEHNGVIPTDKDEMMVEPASLTSSSPTNMELRGQNHEDNASTYLGPYSEYASLMQNIHWFGAFCAFIIGILWMFLQSVLTLRMGVRGVYFCIRIGISVAALFFVVVGIALALSAAVKNESGKLKWDDSAHNLETRKGRLSVAAACCEWLACFLIVSFTATFVPEFRHYDLKRAGVRSKGALNPGGTNPTRLSQHVPGCSAGNGTVHEIGPELQSHQLLEEQENLVHPQNSS
eukprot:TCALIF_12669-PA protein Name:"Similar to Dram2 DNA damage-regulated autophagy modulator protein 2 (Mus musculus)" AED:0.13 eAED:0.14 QI:0/0.75/0.8/1/1/1/5/949/322